MLKLLVAIAAAIMRFFAAPGGAMALMAYVGAVSLVTFAAFGADKWFAAHGLRRIPEDVLLILVCLGGTVGAFAGQMFFKHKTRKPYFNRALITIFLVQVLIILGYSFAVIKRS